MQIDIPFPALRHQVDVAILCAIQTNVRNSKTAYLTGALHAKSAAPFHG
jgi:hypothetical protein